MKRKTLQKLNNRGFSLVELVIAIAILAIVSVPLLQAFVTAAKTSGKATEVGRATLAAQNIYENIKAAPFDVLFPKDGKSETDHVPASEGDLHDIFDATADNITMQKKDVKEGVENAWVEEFDLTGVNAGSRKYDAHVTLDASPAEAVENPEDADPDTRNPYYKNSSKDGVNDIPLTTYTQFDNVFTQTGDLDYDPDDRVENVAVGKDDVNFDIKRRTIELTFDYEDTDNDGEVSAGDTVKPVVTYCYYLHYTYTEPAAGGAVTGGGAAVTSGAAAKVTKEETLDGSDMSDKSLEGQVRFVYHLNAIKHFDPEKNFRVWIFYKPYYEAKGDGAVFHWAASNSDTGFNGTAWNYPPASKDLFLINNQKKFKADVCLIPQTDSVDPGYTASIRLFEPGDGMSWNMDIWSNMGQSLADPGHTEAPIGSFYLLRYNRYSVMNGQEAVDSSGVIKKIAGDRLCQVKIDVYPSGHSDSDKALYTLNGVKLR